MSSQTKPELIRQFPKASDVLSPALHEVKPSAVTSLENLEQKRKALISFFLCWKKYKNIYFLTPLNVSFL